MSKLRWGVLGTGKIVDKGGPALLRSDNGLWLGVSGRTVEQSIQAANRYGVERAYEGYQQLLDDPDIDAVYIALLNHLHFEWMLKAIEAGKHVLCEKPLTLTADEAKRVRAAADARGVQVMEAFVWRYQPAHAAIKEAISKGSIGEPMLFNGHFSFAAPPSSTRLVKAWGGGALFDLGCYPISWSRFVFDADPKSIDCSIVYGVSGVDVRSSALLHYPEGKTAHISCTLDTAGGAYYEVIGTKGIIRLRYEATPEKVTTRVEFNGEFEQWTSDRIEPFRLQAEAFAEAVLNGVPAPYGLTDSIANMSVIDACFAADRDGKRAMVGR